MKYSSIIHDINSLNFSGLDDSNLTNIINNIRFELSHDKSPNDVLIKAFSVIKEVVYRRLGMKAYDVQLMGALALYEGKIAEMGTGEGKTLVAVFTACLWALSGKKVHIATVNDYLASRDCEWMSPVYQFMGLNVDSILSFMTDTERKNAYKAHVVYGNNYEFSFDYLRDNAKNSLEDRIQNKLEYVIIDEIDSILMDEATTPLIISSKPENVYATGLNIWKFKATIQSLVEMQNHLVDELFCQALEETENRYIKLIQIKMADPWNKNLMEYLSQNKEAHKKMRAIWAKFASARSEYKLEEDLFYVIDERQHTVKLTDRGISLIEEKLGQGFMTLNPEDTYNGEIRDLLQLLRAYALYRKDEDYIVQNGRIIIVDEFTGRLAFGKKYEEGLHQAIECKENISITPENRVTGRITHPNYFRLYEKMTGMSATAYTEAQEFKKLYKLDVVKIPTNKQVIRVDLPDRLYKTEEEKLEAIISEIEEYHNLGRPVLVGTRSVEKSERLSDLLSQRKIEHNVLNAKNHAQEAKIIKSAGQPYAVTIATNMAGRGTDIILGNSKLGLHVIGTERHEARRIDDQLKGRSGRQGDIGSSRFFLSLQDDLFRIFGQGEMKTSNLIGLVKKAQKKSEEMSYNIRKYVIDRDDVADKQRKVIYEIRQETLTDKWDKEKFKKLIEEFILDIIACKRYINTDELIEQWNLSGLEDYCINNFGVNIPNLKDVSSIEEAKIALIEAFYKAYEKRAGVFGADFSQKLCKAAMINALEIAWTDYLSFQSEFDRALMLRSYVKGDTLTDYKLESAKMFKDLLASILSEAIKGFFAYPLPEEKRDAIRQTENNKKLSKEIEEILLFSL